MSHCYLSTLLPIVENFFDLKEFAFAKLRRPPLGEPKARRVTRQNDYKAALDETISVHSSDWFGESVGYLNEIDFAMPNYNPVLTLLWESELR